MKLRNFIIISLISLVVISCTSTEVERISSVTVDSGGESYVVELSHSVEIPISKSSAMFIMEECYEGYNSSLGEPELIDDNWEFYWGPEFPDFEIKVNRNNGDVTITQFG